MGRQIIVVSFYNQILDGRTMPLSVGRRHCWQRKFEPEMANMAA